MIFAQLTKQEENEVIEYFGNKNIEIEPVKSLDFGVTLVRVVFSRTRNSWTNVIVDTDGDLETTIEDCGPHWC